MEAREFKDLFGQIARRCGFERAFSGFFKETNECILVLELQKSKYGKYYYVNLKIFIQDLFGIRYDRNKDLVKKDLGTIFRRQPESFKDALDLEYPMTDEMRIKRVQLLFEEFIMPFSEKALTNKGLKELALKQEIFLLPAVKEKLGS